MSKFGAFIIGYVIFTGGVAWAMYLVGVPAVWIGAAVLMFLGIGVFTGAKQAKRDDPPAD